MNAEKLRCCKQRALRLLFLSPWLLASGCGAAWNATPERTQADYGASVRNMVNNQIYDPVKTQQPAVLAPDGIEGNKADATLQSAYRGVIGKPEEVRRPQSTSSGSSSSASK
jgi:hypothetical protein